MKTRRCFALLLALMLVLTGCAANAAEEEEEPSGDTAGADWRTNRIWFLVRNCLQKK